MKTLKTLLFFLIIGTTTLAQTSPNVTSKTQSSFTTEQEVVKSSTATELKFEGKTVYKTSKGSYFIVKQSKKSGKFYKQYVNVTN